MEGIMSESKPIIPDWYAVVFNETAYCNLQESSPFIEKMISVYIYNANSVTHLCEITPSYFLAHVYDDVVFKDEAFAGMPEAEAEEKREEICDKLLHGPGSGVDQDTYMHVSAVDAIPADRKNHYGTPRKTEADEGDGEDEVREYYQGNCPF
jgi:hypothetical protein